MREVLLPALEQKLKQSPQVRPNRDVEETDGDDKEASPQGSQISTLSGWENIGRVVLVDQSPLGKTPRSNPAVYIGAFDEIRNFFAATEIAKQRGLNASAFSFNSAQGQCERCRGAGFEKIEMQFLSDVFIRCPDCKGRRYREHILEVKVNSQLATRNAENGRTDSVFRAPRAALEWSIADLLEATVDEVIEFLAGFPESRYATRAIADLKLLQDVGLGYLRLGQPINTLSGGESQRLKLVSHLAEAEIQRAASVQSNQSNESAADFKPTLFLFDEPTTGLHFDDVRVLLKVFQRLVDAGNAVLVIEHNLDVIKSADWMIELGPEAGDDGGKIIAAGTPEMIALIPGSHTGAALAEWTKTSKSEG